MNSLARKMKRRTKQLTYCEAHSDMLTAIPAVNPTHFRFNEFENNGFDDKVNHVHFFAYNWTHW